MPQLTLNRKDLDKFAAFINKHNLDNWFLAKDDGAYIGATGGNKEDGTFENIIFYFKGCNPHKDENFWDEGQYKFGGDDFGEHFETDIVKKAAADPTTTKLVVNVSANSISVKSYTRKAAPIAPKPLPTVPPKLLEMAAPPKKLGIGAYCREAIQKGLTNNEILKEVKAVFPEAKTTANSLNWYRNELRKKAA